MHKILIIILLVFSAPAFAQIGKQNNKATKPFILGVIDEIQSRELNEKRILNIYLPEDYDENAQSKYPVIYLLDGSANEDFIHVVGLVQYDSFEWVNLVPKSIVVGIASVDRRRDFTYPTKIAEDRKRYPTTGHSDKFIAFIEKELQPFIENNYRTTSEKTIIGQSLGGLLATEILYKKPSLFNKYIIVSPSLWWDNGSMLSLTPPSFADKKIYIAVGKEGLTSIANPRVMEVDVNVLAEKIKTAKNANVDVYFDYLPEENHATIMHQAIMNAFKLLYSKAEK